MSSANAAAESPPAQRLYWESFTGASYNSLGLVEQLTLGYQLRLYQSDSEILENNFIELAVIGGSSPAYGLGGVRLWIQPLSILNLRVRYEGVGYYGTFGNLQSFTDPFAEHDDDTLSDLKDAGTNYVTTATRLWLTAQLQARVGPVALRNTSMAVSENADLRDGDRVFYSPLLDYLMEDGGWTFRNNLDVVYITDIPLVLGVRYNVMWSTYSEDLAEEDPNGPAHRVGPLFVWPFWTQPDGVNGRAVLLLNWYLKHRYRAGQSVNQAIPYIGGGVTFTGDIF